MKKGVIFSTDAILAMIVVIALFSGLAIIGDSYKDGFEQPLLSAKASDSATMAYYTNSPSNDAPPGGTANASCKQMFQYDNASGVEEKVKECRAE